MFTIKQVILHSWQLEQKGRLVPYACLLGLNNDGATGDACTLENAIDVSDAASIIDLQSRIDITDMTYDTIRYTMWIVDLHLKTDIAYKLPRDIF